DTLQERFAERPSDDWVQRLHACEVPAAPIIERQRLFTEPQVRQNGMLLEQEHPALGRVTMIAPPLRMSAATAEMRRPAPAIGQHTAEVLGELGYARAEIDALAQAGVVRVGATQS
ncbi:MAG: CoA transferase, partial [Chloroflexi bacterium]|nr:CoA transferase [Chloroflexota bacterium]